MTNWLRVVILLSMLAPFTIVRAAQQEPPNKPDYCANDGNPDPVHACACHQMCDPLDKEKQGGEDSMCKNYCTKEHCHCKAMCNDTK